MVKDKDNIEELSLLFHEILFLKNNIKLEEKFNELESFNSNEISVINILGHKENVSVKDIVDTLNIPKSTLTGAINKLEKHKYIKRKINETDKRSYKIELTDTGRKISEAHIEFDKYVSKKVLLSLDNCAEREDFLRLFKKIINNLKDELKERN